MCGAGCLHLHWVVALLKRGDTRNKFGVKGDGCTDCLASYFCFPCTVAQMDTEIKDRVKAAHHEAKQPDGYSQAQNGMVYGQQPLQQPPHQPQQGYHDGAPKS
ncbi:hypothetical protein LTR09_006735 [Extremus antarcticus]|uniref:Uncharacterized protein n=1 Tax=Extremus antarcticus TaxID=702011 RepID=A0AAJ0DKS6_9PEZI|nr:hypothetical protein LTR09_006735 [Extremus antarcticus]